MLIGGTLATNEMLAYNTADISYLFSPRLLSPGYSSNLPFLYVRLNSVQSKLLYNVSIRTTRICVWLRSLADVTKSRKAIGLQFMKARLPGEIIEGFYCLHWSADKRNCQFTLQFTTVLKFSILLQ